ALHWAGKGGRETTRSAPGGAPGPRELRGPPEGTAAGAGGNSSIPQRRRYPGCRPRQGIRVPGRSQARGGVSIATPGGEGLASAVGGNRRGVAYATGRCGEPRSILHGRHPMGGG